VEVYVGISSLHIILPELMQSYHWRLSPGLIS
jgi:hypothetical protein